MKDIKIKKINTNKVAEPEKFIPELNTISIEGDDLVEVKKKSSVLSVILFGFMSTSIICYVFLIASSIFYSIKANQYDYQSESLEKQVLSQDIDLDVKHHFSSDRISYINQDKETAISLK